MHLACSARVALPLLVTAAVTGCGSSSSMPAAKATHPALATTALAHRATARAGAVSVRDFDFTPRTLTVKVGARVAWHNRDQTNHTVTFSGAGAPKSIDDLAEGASASRRFTRPGTYAYVCTFHPNMRASVVVSQ